MSDKQRIIDTLENIARLLELKGENPFKVRAYANAVRTLETVPLGDAVLADAEQLASLDGIGKAIAEKIATLATTGRLPFYEELRAAFPGTIMDLFELQGLGAKKIKVLYDQLGVGDIPALKAACEDGRVAELAGFGEKSAANFLKAIAQWEQGVNRFLFGSIAPVAIELLEELKRQDGVLRAEIAGSFRRRKEIVGDLDFLAATREPESLMKWFTSHPLAREILACGHTKSSVVLQNGIQCDLRAVTPQEFPFALNYFTGSKEHNVRMRGLCLERGWSLNEYRFSLVEGKTPTDPLPEVAEEADIYHALGLDFVPPELRENTGEIEAAAAGTLPRLVELENLRGTFHNHTTESDGRNTLEEMAAAARDLGLAYLGIADHSKSSFQAHGLDEKRLSAQIHQIAELNSRLGGELTIFSGTECDILKDGSLDFSDEVLAQLDYVVASVHSSFQLPSAEMTRRLIRAMENPHVTMLGHLTGRLLLAREPYALDIPTVLEAAAATGTIIELNANPRRFDMDWRWWPMARSMGVRCSINPDAHSINGLKDLFFGIGIARKGWLTRADVINCLDLEAVKEVLRAKKVDA